MFELLITSLVALILAFQLFTFALQRRKSKTETSNTTPDATCNQAFDLAKTILLSLDKNADVSMINDHGCQVLGFARDEILGRNWFEVFVDPVSRDEARIMFGDVLNGRETDTSFEYELSTRSGARRLFQGHYRVMCEQSGRIDGLLCAGSDITENRRSERLHELRTGIMERIASGVVLEEVLEYTVRSAQRLSPEMACSILLLEEGKLRHGAAVGLSEEYCAAIDGVAIGDGVGSCGTAAFRGERVIVEDIENHPYWQPFLTLTRQAHVQACWSEPIKGKNGNILGTFAIYYRQPRSPSRQDLLLITSVASYIAIAIEHHIANSALRKSEERFSLAMKGASDGLWDWDLVTNEVYFSPRWKDMLGYADDELPSTLEAWQRLLHPDDVQPARQVLRHFLAGETEKYSAEFRMLHKDGHYVDVLARGFLVYSEDGATQLRMVGTHVDISEMKRKEKELTEAKEQAEFANQAKSEFLSHMSHEFRTPLNAVMGFAQILDCDVSRPLSPEQKESVMEILQASNQLLDLVNGLLELAKLEKAGVPLQPESLPVNEMVEACLDKVRPMAEKRGVFLDFETMAELHVLADKQRFNQVLMNYLINAIKYSPVNGRVTLRLTTEGPLLKFDVIDQGPGIELEKQQNIFEAFVRLRGAQLPDQGAGIGLSISRNLVEGMGGSVGVHSQPGQGATFWFTLPTAEKASLTSHAHFLSTTCGQRRQGENPLIYLIERDEANLDLFLKFLARSTSIEFKHSVVPVAAINEVVEIKPDMLLLDLNLENINAKQVLESLQRKGFDTDVPVVAVIDNIHSCDIAELREMGFAAYLTKPVDYASVEQVLSHYLDFRAIDWQQEPTRIRTSGR